MIQLLQRGYLKDNNAAAHSVYSDIFYAVSHLPARSKTYINLCLKVTSNRKESVSLYESTSCMMRHRWRGVARDSNNKAHSDLNCVWKYNDTHHRTSPFNARSRK